MQFCVVVKEPWSLRAVNYGFLGLYCSKFWDLKVPSNLGPCKEYVTPGDCLDVPCLTARKTTIPLTTCSLSCGGVFKPQSVHCEWHTQLLWVKPVDGVVWRGYRRLYFVKWRAMTTLIMVDGSRDETLCYGGSFLGHVVGLDPSGRKACVPESLAHSWRFPWYPPMERIGSCVRGWWTCFTNERRSAKTTFKGVEKGKNNVEQSYEGFGHDLAGYGDLECTRTNPLPKDLPCHFLPFSRRFSPLFWLLWP